MRRQYQNALSIFALIAMTFSVGLYFAGQEKSFTDRTPAAAGDWTAADFAKAHPSVTLNEFLDSKPETGRSYFDQIFSSQDQYQIPYPFNKLMKRLSDYSGQAVNSNDSSGIKATLFPMGRSLQRNAAITGQQTQFSYDPFFRFPRAVVGVDEETSSPQELRLNLKNKFYIGYNERAEILEVISFNDQAGRYEYQLVKNYAAGKKPEVLYANRSLCLSCHQNQTPIFSRGPWSESNANPFVHEKLQVTFDQAFGRKVCQNPLEEPYCYINNKAYYFGLPIKVDISIPYLFDTSTDQGNLIHAYQKMWTKLCPTIECRQQFVRAALIYRLTSKLGLIPDAMMASEFAQFENRWKQNFPNGLTILSPNIPNRDPFKDVTTSPQQNALQGAQNLKDKTVQELLTLSKIPSEFEPLQVRAPLDIWMNSGFDTNQTNRLIRGIADEFTQDDIRIFQKGLMSARKSEYVLGTSQANCEVFPDKGNLAITCEGLKSSDTFQLSGYLKLQGTVASGPVSDFKLVHQSLKCDPTARTTDANVFSGKSCPTSQELIGQAQYLADGQKLLLRLFNLSGFPYYTLHGFEASEILIDIKTQKSEMRIYNVMQALTDNQKKSIDQILAQKFFSRFDLMKAFMMTFNMSEPKIEKQVSANLPLHIDGESVVSETEDQILAKMNPHQVLQKVCATCHQNDEGVPPDFMGSKLIPPTDQDQCRRVEQCAARILYRLKMRSCDAVTSQKKKNPMPPPLFFKKNPHLTDTWAKNHNPKLIQYVSSLIDVNSLARSISQNGTPAVEAQAYAADLLSAPCPKANSVIYEQFPLCEFNQMTVTSRCR